MNKFSINKNNFSIDRNKFAIERKGKKILVSRVKKNEDKIL